MEILKLLGILIVIVGFILKLDSILIIMVAAVVTALVSGIDLVTFFGNIRIEFCFEPKHVYIYHCTGPDRNIGKKRLETSGCRVYGKI